MKKNLLAFGLILGMVVFGSSLSRAESGSPDTVNLKDGTVLKGQVVEETDDYVVIQFNGAQRKISRGLVSGVVFNSAAQAPAPASAPAAPDSQVYTAAPANGGSGVPTENSEFNQGISQAYKVPVEEVAMVENQGIPVEEVPVVFFLAARAHVVPSAIIRLRLGGMSWMNVSLHFGLSPSIYYMPVNGTLPVAPYDRIYLEFRSRPRRLWRNIVLADLDIVNCVNLRFVSLHWHMAPIEVMRLRAGGGHFPHIWWGYAHPGGTRHGVVARRGRVIERERDRDRRHEDRR